MKKRAIITLTLSAMLLASCAATPENVKNKKQGQEDKVEIGDRVTVDRLLEGAEDVSVYIKEHSYEGKFVLDNEIHIDLPEQIFELETETVQDAYLKFPEVYSELFGSDFYSDSGVKDFSELPPQSEHLDAPGFFFDDWSSLGDGIIYTEGGATNPESKQYLEISSGGFIFYFDAKNPTDGDIKDIFNARSGSLPDTEYTMKNNEKCSLKALIENTDQKLNAVFGNFGDQFTYHAGRVFPIVSDDGTAAMYIDVEKYYKGVSFCNHIITDYPVKGRMQYAPIYIAEADEPQHLSELDSPYGIDRVISEKELTDGLVPLSQSLDIMNNELSPKIELHISDIRLCYMCDYDSSEVEAALELLNSQTWQELPREQQQQTGNPTLVTGRRYRAYPVWEFRIDRILKDDNGNYRQKEACDLITVDVQTGELTEYFDKVSIR